MSDLSTVEKPGPSSIEKKAPDTTEILRQKEENRRKQKLVKHEFSQRYNQARLQAQNLEKIRAELQKLDTSLYENIDILRQQIEAEDRNVAVAQYRYDDAEKEFLDAKRQLEKHRNKKRLLSEHLDLIILTNEKEKAHKLEQIMAKLGVTDSGLPVDTPTNGTSAPSPATASASASSLSPAPANPKVAFKGFSTEEIEEFDLKDA